MFHHAILSREYTRTHLKKEKENWLTWWIIWTEYNKIPLYRLKEERFFSLPP